MEDSAAALRPLDEARQDLDRLRSYESEADLATALTAVHAAVETTLRRTLRADPSAPEHQRLSALSRTELPLAEVVRSLRTRDLLSLETAGTLHEFEAAAERARARTPRASDADVALRAVARLREDLGAGDRASVPAAVGPSPAPPVQVAGAAEPAVPPERRGRGFAILGAVLAGLVVLLMAVVLGRGGGGEFDAAVAAFRAGRLDSAAVGFQRVLEERPTDVDALLFMGRIHRRLERPAGARIARMPMTSERRPTRPPTNPLWREARDAG